MKIWPRKEAKMQPEFCDAFYSCYDNSTDLKSALISRQQLLACREAIQISRSKSSNRQAYNLVFGYHLQHETDNFFCKQSTDEGPYLVLLFFVTIFLQIAIIYWSMKITRRAVYVFVNNIYSSHQGDVFLLKEIHPRTPL